MSAFFLLGFTGNFIWAPSRSLDGMIGVTILQDVWLPQIPMSRIRKQIRIVLVGLSQSVLVFNDYENFIFLVISCRFTSTATFSRKIHMHQ